MKYQRKHQHKAVWRKTVSPIVSIKEWSRMLHKWWKRDVIDKKEFKKLEQKDNICTVCLPCGRRYGHAKKSGFGIWFDSCDICGDNDVACASAPHDFGIYSSPEIEADDKIQRKI